MEWSKKQTLDLIELIHIHDCLWNVKSETYKDRQKKRDSIEDIASQMKISFNDVEKKITNLKNQYNRELNKIKTKSGCGTEDVYVSSWYAFKALSFLKSNNLPRKSRNSDSMIEEDNCEDEYINNPMNVEICTTPSTSEVLQILSPNTVINQSAKRFKPDRQAEAFEMIKEARNNIVNCKKKDDFDIFGEYVASELRGIKGKKNILNIKKQIQDLIYYKKIEQIENKENTEEGENIPIEHTTSNQMTSSSTQVVDSPDNTYIEDENILITY